jgi:hypothetical protein
MSLPPECRADVGVGMEQDDEGDEEVGKAVEDDVVGGWNPLEVAPTATILHSCVTPHLGIQI